MTFEIIKNVIPKKIITDYIEAINEVNCYFNEEPSELTLSGRVYDISNTLHHKYRFVEPILEHVEKFTKSDKFFTAGWQLRLDRPSNSTELLGWHRDCDYFKGLGILGAVAWVPLTDITHESGGIEVAIGEFIESSFEPVNKVYQHPGRKPHSVWEVEYGESKNETVICEVGDLVLFDLLTPHRSIPNSSAKTRITLQIRFFNYDINTTLNRSDIELR